MQSFLIKCNQPKVNYGTRARPRFPSQEEIKEASWPAAARPSNKLATLGGLVSHSSSTTSGRGAPEGDGSATISLSLLINDSAIQTQSGGGPPRRRATTGISAASLCNAISAESASLRELEDQITSLRADSKRPDLSSSISTTYADENSTSWSSSATSSSSSGGGSLGGNATAGNGKDPTLAQAAAALQTSIFQNALPPSSGQTPSVIQHTKKSKAARQANIGVGSSNVLPNNLMS